MQPIFRPRVPFELCDEIIDYLWDNHDTLVACSLVCHQWLPRVRLHLYRSVSIVNAAQFTRFERLIKRTPSIASCVRTFSIGKTSRAPRMDREWPRLLLRMNKVETLTVSVWHVRVMPEDMKQNLHTYFPMVKTFNLTYIVFGDEDLLRLLHACPKLSSLRLASVTMATGGEVQTSTEAGPSQTNMASNASGQVATIESLTLMSTSSAIGLMLLRSPLPTHLRRLQLGGSHSEAMTSQSAELLRAVAPLLEHLVLSVFSGTEQEVPWSLAQAVRPLRDVSFGRLHSLHLKNSWLESEENHALRPVCSLTWMLYVLKIVAESTNCPGLKELTISVRWFDLWSEHNPFPWTTLDWALNILWKRGVHITINICDHTDMDRWGTSVVGPAWRRLPSSKSRIRCGHVWSSDAAFGGDLVGRIGAYGS